jgi:hypothetical protein
MSGFDPEREPNPAALQAQPKVDLRTQPMETARATFRAQQLPWAWSDEVMAEIRDIEVPGAVGAMSQTRQCERCGWRRG